jgi:predicted acylesterase/phospholipase RssA
MTAGLWTGVTNGLAALVLSGGASQGDFEVGVARYLFERGFQPGLITSASVGSVNAVKLVEGGSINPTGLEQIWLTKMQTNSDMYTPNPVFNLQRVTGAAAKLGPDWWLQVGGVASSFATGLPAPPVLSVISTTKQGVDLASVENALNTFQSANSQYTLDPLRMILSDHTILDPNKIKSSSVKLLMATVSLESGDLRFVTKEGTVLQPDAVTPYSEAQTQDINSLCQPLEDQASALRDRLQGGLSSADRQLLMNSLALVQRQLRDCITKNPGAHIQPLTGVSMVDGVMASAAIPFVFPPVKLGKQNYVDGGVRSAVPIRAALANGATNIWAVLTYSNKVGSPFLDPLTHLPVLSFDGANWIDIAARAAMDIMPTRIAEADVSPPAGWGSNAVTVVEPEAGGDVHNGFTIDPGLIRIRIMHGYMRADDMNTARCLAAQGLEGGDYLGLADKVSLALHTTEIVQLRHQIWVGEHPALGMQLNIDNLGVVQKPSTLSTGPDPAALSGVQNMKKQLERLAESRRSGRNPDDGTPITVDGKLVGGGAVPEEPEPSNSWWLQFEKHQAAAPTTPPQPALWPTGFVALPKHDAAGPTEGSLLREQNGTVWVIFGQAKFHVPDPATQVRLYSCVPIFQMSDGALLSGIPTIPVDGSLLREENGAIWVVFGQAKFHAPDPATVSRLYAGTPLFQLWDGGPSGIPSIPVDGSLLREENGAIWVVFGHAKFHVPDPATLSRLYAGKPLFQLWDGGSAGIPNIPNDMSFLGEENGAIWLVLGQAKFLAPDLPTLVRLYGGAPLFHPPFPLPNGGASEIPNIPVDGTLLREENGTLWAVFGHAKFHVADAATLSRLYGSKPVLQLWDGGPSGIPNIPVDMSFLREENGGIWVVLGQAKFLAPDLPTLVRLYGGAPLFHPPFPLSNGSASGNPNIPVNGTLFREESSPQVYLIQNGHKVPAPTNTTGTVYLVWNGALSQIP